MMFFSTGAFLGLRSVTHEGYLKKTWRVMTTDSSLLTLDRMCIKGQHHVHIEGRDTALSAFYPAQKCAKCLQTIPKQSSRTVVLEVAALSIQVVYHCT